jgi:hypothetical protein
MKVDTALYDDDVWVLECEDSGGEKACHEGECS